VTVLAVAILVIAILLVGVLAVARLATVPWRGGLLRGEAVLPGPVLGEAVLAEATVTEGVLLVVGGFGALLRVRLGLVVRPGPAGVARLLTRVRPTGTGGLFVTVAVVRPSAALAVADNAVRT